MIKQFLIICIFCLPSILSAQITIEGYVLGNSNKHLIENAVVIITNSKQDIVKYQLTDVKGNFSMECPSSIDSIFLNISLLGYKTQNIALKRLSQKLKITLQESEIELKEVKIIPPLIWQNNDTLVFNVDKLKSQQDKNIGNILKKIPGVEVTSIGGIKYNGTPINKLYIEGLDLLEGKYNIATNNVPVDAVTNIEILENHQPIENIRGTVFSEQAAINIKLKSGKTMRPIGNVDIGSGYEDKEGTIWQLSSFAMQMGEKNQTIVTYKANNSGINLASELTDHILTIEDLLNLNKEIPSNLLDVNNFNNPPLHESRYLFNKTYILSINNLRKSGKNSQLRFNFNYMNEKRNEAIQQNSSFLLGDSTLYIEENDLLFKKVNYLDALVTYNHNSKKYYLDNALKIQSKWDDTKSDILLQNSSINQNFHTPVYYVQNNLKFYKTRKKQIFNVTSYVRYSSLPQKLKVITDSIYESAAMNISRKGFYTNNSTSLRFAKGYSSFDIKIKLEGNFENMQSTLKYVYLTDSIRNDIKTDYLNITIYPNYIYKKDKFTFNFTLPITQHLLWVNNYQYSYKINYDYLYVLPTMQVRYKLSTEWDTYLKYRYNRSVGDIMDFAQSYTMLTYRNLSASSSVLSRNQSESYSIGINYKNHLTAFFFNTNLSYIPSKRNLISNQHFNQTISYLKRFENENYQKKILWRNYVGKFINSISTNISLSTNYNYSKYSKLQQNEKYPVYYTILQFQPKIDSKLIDKLSINYQGDVIYNKMRTEHKGQNSKSSFFQSDQRLNLFYFPSNIININFQVEYLYNDLGSTSTNTNHFFADFGILFKLQQWEIGIMYKNIFNKQSYSYMVFSDLDTFSYNYKLRATSIMANLEFKF